MDLMKKFFVSFMAVCVFTAVSVPAFAVEPTTVITTQEEHYRATSPTGYFAQYPQGSVVQTVNTGYGTTYSTGYIPVNDTILNTVNTIPQYQYEDVAPATYQTTSVPTTTVATVPVSYETVQPMPATIQQIDTPQQYDKVVTTTQSVRDDREKADKILDRSFKTVGILGVAGLFAAGITAIFASL